MKVATACLLIGFVATVCGSARAVEFEAIEPEMAQEIARRLLEQSNSFDQPQIKIEADADKANGVHIPEEAGALVVPQRNLRESEEFAAQLKTEKGAALGYLFLYHIVPVANGKPVEDGQLRTVTIREEQGKEHRIYALMLAAKQVADDDYRLHAYGTGPQPLVDVQFKEQDANVAKPVAVEIKDANEATKRGRVVITVFGKYQVEFPGAHRD